MQVSILSHFSIEAPGVTLVMGVVPLSTSLSWDLRSLSHMSFYFVLVVVKSQLKAATFHVYYNA